MTGPTDHGVEPLPLVRARMREGLRLLEAGQLGEARVLFQQAGALQPELVDAPKMSGVCAFMLGDLVGAERDLLQARGIDPQRGDVLQNLGLVYGALGRHDQEVEAFRAALRAEPRNFALHDLLGIAQLRVGDAAGAVETYVALLQLQPRHRGAKLNLAIALAEAPWREWDPGRERLLLDLLVRPDVELGLLPPAVGGMVRHRHAIVRGDEERALLELADDKLLVTALATIHFADPVSELFLTRTRARLLTALTSADPDAERLLHLAAGFAVHSFANDYAFAAGDAELAALGALRASVAAFDAADPAQLRALLVLAMYERLAALPGADAIAALPPNRWPVWMRRLIRKSVTNPRREVALAAAMPVFGRLRAESAAVAEMYEQHPYPRWQGIAFVNPLPLGPTLADALPGWVAPAWSDGRPFDVLIAGCGTGRHALRAALHYQGSRVLAVDISRRSLGYAQRMAQRLGVKNLEFLTCDILELPELGRRFQLVETIGTFETLADPRHGWEALRPCLTDDGLLHVGSYSEPGRAPVVRARERIAALGLSGGELDMRRFRQLVLAGELGQEGKALLASGDFYSLVGIRDFLFHVREHRFWLDELAALATGVGLRFVGFHPLKREVGNWFAGHEPSLRKRADLARWGALERADTAALARALGTTMWYGWYEPQRG